METIINILNRIVKRKEAIADIIKVKPGKYIDTICDTTYTTSKEYNKCRNGIN
jgi:hypothetical protein